jgi:hypothetical protein
MATTQHVIEVVDVSPLIPEFSLPAHPFLSSPNRGCIFLLSS